MYELDAKIDGSGKNLIAPVCPYCKKEGGKFGIYIGPEVGRKKLFMSNCFSCQQRNLTLPPLLKFIGRDDLIPAETISFNPTDSPFDFLQEDEKEIDDDLIEIELPEWYRKVRKSNYLKKRGFNADDYEYFEVGSTAGLNFKFDDYVIFPIKDNKRVVGYVGRHTWDKKDIEDYNAEAKRAGKYQIRRYNNSMENEFSKLLYNYDAIVEDETDTVIILEGVFDVISLTRKLELYDNTRIVPVATFGKKISDVQIYKLQAKGVKTVVLGYDGDAVNATSKIAEIGRAHV